MRRACIDIGSNTTRLLVADDADGAVREVAQRRAFTHLRRALSGDGIFTDATLEQVADVVAEQHAVAREQGAVEVIVVATAAVRRSRNPEALVARLRDRLDVELQVLTEADEGRMAFRGACAALCGREPGLDGVTVAVVDVGGGSSEVVAGVVGEGPRSLVSLVTGSGVLTDACLRGDPPGPAELAAAERHVEGLLSGVELPRPARAVAVGGSAMSLCALAGRRLDADAFAAALARLREGPAGSIAPRLGLDPERVRLLPAGLIILRALARGMGVALEPVPGGLREGVLLEAGGTA